MKTFLKTGVLLVSLSALASSPAPAFYQYWFDNDETYRLINTHLYSAQSNQLIIDAGGLSEGGHAVNFRMADKDKKWGSIMTSYFVVPSTTPHIDPKEATEPVLIQYWFDNDEPSRVKNTLPYSGQSNSLEVNVNELSEGGHALQYRMANKYNQWGSMMMRYFSIPSAPDKSSSIAVSYRVLINNNILTSGIVPNNSDFTLTTEMPDNPELGTVNSREFTYRTGEKSITMSAAGKFVTSFQMLSENNEWGMPILSEYEHSVTTKLLTDSVAVPCDYSFKKTDNNNFKAYRFTCGEISTFYLKASQDCSMGLYRVDTSKDSNLALVKTFLLKKGETTKLTDSSLSNRQFVAILYDTKKDAYNRDDDVFLRIMYEDNKLPKPVISFNSATWEVTISCADQRAKIYYTLDGNQPISGNDKRLEYNGPIKLEKFTRVMAIAEYDDLKPSEVADMTISDQNMRLPKPQLEFYGGKELNEFIFTNSVEGVTTYYVLGKGEISDKLLYDAGQRVTYDGNPIVIEDGTSLKAFSTKNLLADSEILSVTIRHNDYVTQAPILSGTKTEGENMGDVSAIKNYVQLSVPEGNAKYRIVNGKKTSTYGEEVVADEWKDCGESWIELPGGPLSGNQTLQAYAETDGKVRSVVVSHYTDWVKALKPKTHYDNSRLVISSEMPGGVIKYNLGNFDPASALEYKTEEHPEGIDFNGENIITTWVQADGYTDSDRVIVNKNEYDLVSPIMRYEADDYLHVTHNMEDVEIVIDVQPVQELTFDTIASNHLRFIPAYNSTVKAYARKRGYNDSNLAIMIPVSKPVIKVDGYTVEIEHADGEVYYTTDGSLPTKRCSKYNDKKFETSACILRATAFKEGMIPAEADAVKVMDQVEKPEIVDISKEYLVLISKTPNAVIYYSLNQGITDYNRQVYDVNSMPDGIDIREARTIYTYAEAEGYRRSESFDFFKSDYVLKEPTIRYSDGYVIAEHDDSNVEIRFTDENNTELKPEDNNPRRVKVAYNSIVNAYTYKKGYIPSDKVRLGHTDIPQISAELFTVTIKKKSSQTVRYTTDGSRPDATSMVYENPFTVSESCTVRAVAFEGELIPAEAESCPIGYVRCQRPEKDVFDGRYLTLKAEEGSMIRYVLGQSTTDIREGSMYTGKIDMEGLTQIRAIALRTDAADSEVMEFTPEYYADETDAYTSRPGALKDAFGWCPDKSNIPSLTLHGPLIGLSTEDSGDYEFLRTFTNLRHLDLMNVTDSYIPTGALDAGNFRSIVLPKQMSRIGSNIFGSANSSLCALEITSDDLVPATLLSGLENSNLLLYVRNANNASAAVANSNGVVKNVVITGTGRAESITLRHGLPFHAHKEFTAENISFTRAFTKQTQIGGFGSGWETMVVPFNIQKIESAGRVLKPFGDDVDTNKGECPFWLFGANDTEWKAETSIFANTPYLIAMPNHPYYASEFVVNSDVVFSSKVVTVPMTPSEIDMQYSFGVGRSVSGNYSWICKEEGKLTINEAPTTYMNQEYQPGGIFISNERDIEPFECYVESQGVRAIPVFDQSSVEGLIDNYGTCIWSEKYSICIRSSIAMKLRIYDMVGQLIRIVDVNAGETERVYDITPGIYFVGTTKILVKG